MVEVLGYGLAFVFGGFTGMAMMALLMVSAEAEERARRMRDND